MLTQSGVRAVMLAAQGLCEPPLPRTKADVRQTIRRLHVLQIDTISVVARSPYFVLWSRLGDYEPRWLDELLSEGALFEYWAHAACFLPIEDYGLYRRRMLGPARWPGHGREWLAANEDVATRVLSHIHERGAVLSSAFERSDGQKSGWWNWKAEKLALECLFDAGDLMIAKRQNFQRVYDLQTRVLPTWDDSNVPSEDEVNRQFVLNSVAALGVCKADWIADYARISKAAAKSALKALLDEGQIRTVDVEGWSAPGFFHPDNEALVTEAEHGPELQAPTTLLSPFDPIVWDRARALDLFGFDYRIECYTPAPKRKYGYFSLPILHKNALVGRLDPKAHRKDGVFEVKALHFEPGVIVDDDLVACLRDALKRCAGWHQTPTVVVRETSTPGLAALLRS